MKGKQHIQDIIVGCLCSNQNIPDEIQKHWKVGEIVSSRNRHFILSNNEESDIKNIIASKIKCKNLDYIFIMSKVCIKKGRVFSIDVASDVNYNKLYKNKSLENIFNKDYFDYPDKKMIENYLKKDKV